MPEQHFYCESQGCDFYEERYVSIKEELPKICPLCKKETLKVKIGSFMFFDGTPKTLGTQAERNTIIDKTRVQEERSKLEETNPILKQKKKARENAPFWRKGTLGPDKSLAKMTPEQQTKYILEGKK